MVGRTPDLCRFESRVGAEIVLLVHASRMRVAHALDARRTALSTSQYGKKTILKTATDFTCSARPEECDRCPAGSPLYADPIIGALSYTYTDKVTRDVFLRAWRNAEVSVLRLLHWVRVYLRSRRIDLRPLQV
jgi:hypothetical protein